ncbi:CHAT domain-containing protein [Spirosoma panaciterrae]|uniref:CHAT domain-containing protein n=1 Tax=Spirosoma panaciterrae TaxID=496058 RepID=UPI0003620E43|nr:CHAT domain-containing protein [Spirosoma panaciterrae]
MQVIGKEYQAIGNPSKAEAHLVHALSILEKLVPALENTAPSKLAQLSGCRQDLAMFYAYTGQYAKVTPQLREALKISQEIHRQFFNSKASQVVKEALLTVDFGVRMSIPLTAYILKRNPDNAAIQQLSYDASLYLNSLLMDESRQVKENMRNLVKSSKDPEVSVLYEKLLVRRQIAMNSPTRKQPQQKDDKTPPTKTQDDALDDTYELEEELGKLLESSQSIYRAPQTITWTQVRDSLKPNQAAVSFVRFMAALPSHLPMAPPSPDSTTSTVDTLYAAMVIKRGYTYPHFVLLTNQQQIRNLLPDTRITTSRGNGGRGPSFDNINYKDSLYHFLWRPIEKLVQNTTHIFFSTEGLLNQIPFAAIPLPGTTASTPVANRFLSGRHQLHQLFSTRQIALGIRPLKVNPTTSLILMGDVDYGTANTTNNTGAIPKTFLTEAIQDNDIKPFNEIPYTKQEVNALHRLRRNSVVYTSREATEKRIRSLSGNGPTILHLATHGLYIPSKPTKTHESNSDESLMRSAIVLAGANKIWQRSAPQSSMDDGLLTAYEVADLDFHKTRLVVLSACQSALGDLRGTEEVYGLQRGFRIAGVEKLIISLWNVSDKYTEEFMLLFYKQLEAGIEANEAFRIAQRMLQKTQPDPTFWAAFVFVE